jgi:hypothetical protein
MLPSQVGISSASKKKGCDHRDGGQKPKETQGKNQIWIRIKLRKNKDRDFNYSNDHQYYVIKM